MQRKSPSAACHLPLQTASAILTAKSVADALDTFCMEPNRANQLAAMLALEAHLSEVGTRADASLGA